MSEPESSHTEIDPPSAPADVAGELLDDPRVVEVVQEYLWQLEQGLAPDREAHVRRYPELADAVARCLEGLELVRAAAPRSDSAGGRRAVAAQRTPQSLGDFQIVRELARGGMGIVYEAVQLSLGRRVALKVLPFAATFDARQLQRFKNEAQAAALLHHTNIVPIYAVGCERGVHFYAMQLIEGQSVAVLIRQLRRQAGLADAADRHSAGPSDAHSAVDPDATGPYLLEAALPPSARGVSHALRSTADVSAGITAHAPRDSETYFQKIARLVLQAADALDHAHQLGVVHRDIKPANLMVNAEGALWITDFGLAQFQVDAGLTRTGDLLGTFRYMSPEQAAGQRTILDQRTDIYSLGATFYELLTLHPVFAGETRQELLYQILHDEPRAPRTLNRAIPVELETIVLKALRKTPSERYATAAELADDIRRFLDHRPILARRPSPLDRLRKWSRRHPSAVVAAALLLLFGVVGLTVSNWMVAAEQHKTAAALEREKEQFRQARQAVDFLIDVGEDDFMMPQTRKRLLQTALTFYEDFIEHRRGETESQADLAKVQERVKRILGELNLLYRDMQLGLLEYDVVLDALQLSDDQRGRVAELLRSWDEERRANGLGEFVKFGDEADQHRMAELAEEHEWAVAEVLSPDQVARLRQLAIQTQGLSAFQEPEVIEALQLSPEQRKNIRHIEREVFAKAFPRPEHGPTSKGRHGPEHDHQRDHERLQAETQAALPRVLVLLSEEQTRRWRQLTGPMVESLIGLGPGGPRGGIRAHGEPPPDRLGPPR